MQERDRVHKAVQKLGHARAAIVRIAAAWQADGVETSPLTEPLVQIQEALAHLEALSPPTAEPEGAPFVAMAPSGPGSAADSGSGT